MEEGRRAFKILTATPTGKRPLGRPRRWCENYIIMDLKEIVAYTRNWIGYAEDKNYWRALMNLRAVIGNRLWERRNCTDKSLTLRVSYTQLRGTQRHEAGSHGLHRALFPLNAMRFLSLSVSSPRFFQDILLNSSGECFTMTNFIVCTVHLI